jgi:hypothetical protein
VSANEPTYTVYRFFQGPTEKQVILERVSLDAAKAYCSDRNASSGSATRPELIEVTRQYGPWFDGFQKDE